ncbi:MAG: hypothetical protein H7287_03125 [Thermoleophilia bacterium]|nr:hypothetical protein [Thermoleophilia bacterium]
MPRPLTMCLLLAAAIALAGCGSGEPNRPAKDPPTTNQATTKAGDEAATAGDDEQLAPAAPGSAAVARGAQLDALVDAYGPVTTRASFLVAAETLRTHARTSDAPTEQAKEYAGAVRLELQHTSAALATARAKMLTQETPDLSVRRLQHLLLAAIAARTKAVADLRLLLVADATTEASHDRRVELRDAWRTAWNESVRSAREATTSMQDAREAVGLEPAPEDGIR